MVWLDKKGNSERIERQERTENKNLIQKGKHIENN